MSAGDRTFAPDWTDAEREQWIADYRAGRPVLMPRGEHWEDECEHCELLRELMAEADRRDAAEGEREGRP